jgi:Na+/H+ antiporter NhaD/arsenite permease-like protein
VHQFSVVLLGTLIAFLAGVPLAWASLGGALAMLLLDGVDPDATGLWVGGGVDWALLIFFSALFIVVESLRRSGWPEKAWDGAAPYLDVTTGLGVFLYALLIVVGSNTVSNVPLVLILSPSLRALSSPDARHRSWLLLAFVSTLAGNLTLVGSVANLIVVARARPWYNLGFVEYVKYGFLSTLVFITLGVVLLGLELS